jgi:hypothetical protein
VSSHQVTWGEVAEYLAQERWDTIAASGGGGGMKALEWNGHGLYRVRDRGAESYLGMSLQAAIDAYNSAP